MLKNLFLILGSVVCERGGELQTILKRLQVLAVLLKALSVFLRHVLYWSTVET